MLKRITTGVAALTALGALALGGSVIASAKQPAQAHHSARAASSTVDPAGGPNDQSGNQSAPDTGSATAASAESDTSASTTDPAGGPNDQSGSQTGGPDTGSATEATAGSETATEAPSSETDGPGGANVQSGSQSGPDTGSSTNG